jgi:hypothetical protein
MVGWVGGWFLSFVYLRWAYAVGMRRGADKTTLHAGTNLDA